MCSSISKINEDINSIKKINDGNDKKTVKINTEIKKFEILNSHMNSRIDFFESKQMETNKETNTIINDFKDKIDFLTNSYQTDLEEFKNSTNMKLDLYENLNKANSQFTFNYEEV